MKTSELTGPALDWAVAKCEGWSDYDPGEPCEKAMFSSLNGHYGYALFLPDYSPSADWSQGGPIIEREGISLLYLYVTDDPFRWAATQKPSIRNVKPKSLYGPTPLVAAMRCYVASKLGDDIKLPEELL